MIEGGIGEPSDTLADSIYTLSKPTGHLGTVEILKTHLQRFLSTTHRSAYYCIAWFFIIFSTPK